MARCSHQIWIFYGILPRLVINVIFGACFITPTKVQMVLTNILSLVYTISGVSIKIKIRDISMASICAAYVFAA